MNNVLRLAIVNPDDSDREALKTMLLSIDAVWLEAECSRYEFFSDVVQQTEPDIGLVVLDSNPEKAVKLIGELHSQYPKCSVLAVSSSTDGNLILQTMRAGAKEFLTKPLNIEDFLTALDRINSEKSGGDSERTRKSKIIALTGASGGVGCTSIGVNVCCGLAQNEKNSVVFLDLDLALGDADVYLDTIPEYTLVDVAQNVSRLDFALLKRSLTKHSSGLYLLPRPVLLQDSELVTPEAFRRVAGLLKATFSHIVIDLSKSFSPLDMTVMELADEIVLFAQLDLPCLRNVVRLMTSLEDQPELKDKIKIVFNRVGLGHNHIGLAKAQETIGREIFWQFPNDYRAMVEAGNNGLPLIEQAPRAAITQATIQFGEILSGERDHLETQSKKASSWLGFLGSKKKSDKKKVKETPEKEPAK